MQTYAEFRKQAGISDWFSGWFGGSEQPQQPPNKYDEINSPSPEQAAFDTDWNDFQKEMGGVWDGKHVNGFDLSDEQLGRLNEYGQGKYKSWKQMYPYIQEQNTQQRGIHTDNMNKFYKSVKQAEQKLGRQLTTQELDGLKAAYNKDNGDGAAERAIAYAMETQNRGKNTGGTPGALGAGATAAPWYGRMWQYMQAHPNISSGLAAALAGGGLFALGAGGKKKDWVTAAILGLLGGGAAYWGMNTLLNKYPAATPTQTA